MSAYASLENLRRITGSGGLWSIGNRGQLHEKVVSFLDFLDNSSAYNATHTSTLEARMREAAYRAEDLIESQISGILHSRSRRFRFLMITTLINIFGCFLIVSNKTHLSFPEMIPERIKIFMFRFLKPVLSGIAVCKLLAFAVSNISENYGSRVQNAQDFRVLLYDLDLVAKEATRIKEAAQASGDLEMSASDALISLQKILDSVLESGDGLRVYCNRAQLRSLHEKVAFLVDFLRHASASMASQEPALQILEAKIRDGVHKAQQLIEFQIPAQFSLDLDRRRFCIFMKLVLHASLSCISALFVFTTTFVSLRLIWVVMLALGFGAFALGMRRSNVSSTAIDDSELRENHELSLIIDGLSVIVEEVDLIKDASSSSLSSSSSSRMDCGGIGKNVVVGLEKDMEQIMARLLQDSSRLEVISIVGMGGIGKTTLASRVYSDLGIAAFFDVQAWVTISQEYSLRPVLLRLLDSAKILTEGKREDSDDELALYLHQYLMSRRYLIVVDDVWDTGIWDFLHRCFPDNHNRSRVLLTSRLSVVASYPDSGSPLHRMQCLNEDESWHLLCETVFGVNVCPSELESTGREIARSCRGLPLAILVIGGLLCKDRRGKIWREVAENLNRILRETEEQCLEILGLSYSHLPHYLRPCFLYMGVFLGDSEIHVSRLINLWVAEGFLKPCPPKSLEKVAEEYLKDLIDRNMILVSKQSCNGKIRACIIHDLLREFCVETARKENFFLVTDGGERLEPSSRRISLRLDDQRAQDLWHELINSCHYARSFHCSAGKLLDNNSGFYLGFLHLRVLDVLVVHFGEFPYQIIKLFHLRYLAFHCDGPLPPSMSKLHNLQTIYHHHCSSRKNPFRLWVVWSLPNLRHLYVKPGCYLFRPFHFRISWKSSVLEHLQTLKGIRNFKWTKDIIERIPNVKNLGLLYNVSSSVEWSEYQLESLVDLHQLETLRIIIKYNDDVRSAVYPDPPKLAFPHELKKLSLSGCRVPWESMTTIGALPNLEALKLRCEACSGTSWETVEGEFPRLMFLLLEEISLARWETDEAHFPRLQRLVVRSCRMLEELPFAIGDIPTLEVIELDDCQPSVVDSAKEIQKEQESMGNVDLKLCIVGLSNQPTFHSL